MAEAMSSWMRKHCGCEHVAEGEVGGGGGGVENVSRLPSLRISFEMCRNKVKGYLNKEILHVVIKHFITQLSSTNRVM